MRSGLALQRCWNHEGREAVARCPECTRSFCRECVVEHEDRVICRGCLEKLAAVKVEPVRRSWSFAPAWRFLSALTGLILAWFLFFSVGRSLLALPEKWHENTLLNSGIFDPSDFEE